MKRSVLALILILSAFFTVYGQNTPMDVILVLDTSSGMSSSYENVSNYITGSFLSEYLRVGDTFHLIAFSGSPRLDIARRIIGREDIETIIGRMLIQYPIESGSNVGAAISYAEQYAASLPARPKKIVIVGTGNGDTNSLINAANQRLSSRDASINFVQVIPGQPLTNLPSSGRPAAQGTRAAAASPAVTPSTTAPAAATPSTTAPAATTPSTTAPAATTPSTTAPAATTPATTAPTATTPSTTAPAATTPATTAPAATTPSTTAPAAATPSATQQTQGTTPAATTPSTGITAPETSTGTETGTAVQPSTGVSETETGTSASGDSEVKPPAESETRKPDEPVTTSPLQPEKKSSTAWTSSMPFIIGIIILALIILGIIVFFATRRLGSSPKRVMAQAASSSKPEPRDDLAPFADHSKDLAKYAAVQNRQRSTPYDDRPVKTESVKPAVINPSGPLLLNLFVEDQNTAIGKRNIHSLKSGYSLSVGGGKSDFLIFLVQVPANIGEIRRDGSQCSFIPKKPKYFPDLGSNELRDCINKTIRVISDKNYELRFRFEMYEDPLVALNRVLMSVSVPG